MRELDGRRRISLTGIGDPEHRYYLASCDDSGVIVLTPAVILPVTEVEQLQKERDLHG
jgi:hypothetical protein